VIDQIKKNQETLKNLLDCVEATDKEDKSYFLEEALEMTIRMILRRSTMGGKVMIIGNGGSAAIASHMSTDFCKNTGVKATAFNDSSMLTCFSNDYGYEYVFQKSIETFAEPHDILIAISSSGKSENILNGAKGARDKDLSIVTFTGFELGNPLRTKGDINFYVPVSHYGHIEVIHHALIHCMINIIIENKKGLKERVVIHE